MDELNELNAELETIQTNIQKTINRPYVPTTRKKKKEETNIILERAQQIHANLQKIGLDSRETVAINSICRSIYEKKTIIFQLIDNWDQQDLNTELLSQSTSTDTEPVSNILSDKPSEEVHLLNNNLNSNTISPIITSLSENNTNKNPLTKDFSENKSNETLLTENNSSESEQNNNNMTHVTKLEFLKLAASTVNKPFSGDPLALQSFIDAIGLLKSFATNDDLKATLITFVLTKLEGKAREAIVGTPISTEDIIENLKAKIKPDSSKIIEGKIRALRVDKMSLQEFSQKTEELAESFRRALVIEGIPGNKAEEMTVEKTIEMCRNNARTDLVKSVLASSNFSNHKEVVSKFIVEINTQQTEKQVLTMRMSNKGNRKGFNKNGKNFNNNRNFNNSRNNNQRGRFRNANNRFSNNNNNNNRNNRYNNNNNDRSRNYRNDNNSGRNNNNANIRVAGNEDVPQWQLGTSQNQNEQN